MQDIIINYLEENKDKFPQEVLEKKLIEKGYPKDQIKEGIKFVYQRNTDRGALSEAPEKTNFWNFKAIKSYTSFSEKTLDFLFGFFIPIISAIAWGKIFSLFSIEILFIPPLTIIGIIYFWKRRNYIAKGFLLFLILPLIIVLIWLFVLFIFRFLILRVF